MGPGFDTSSTEIGDRIPATSRRAVPTERAMRDLREEISGLRASRASRAVIEQAKGVLMATTGCDADEAFALLRQQSQHQNRPVREIAEELVGRAVRRGPAPASSGEGGIDVDRAAHRREGPIQEA
jgi:hypothetical protein